VDDQLGQPVVAPAVALLAGLAAGGVHRDEDVAQFVFRGDESFPTLGGGKGEHVGGPIFPAILLVVGRHFRIAEKDDADVGPFQLEQARKMLGAQLQQTAVEGIMGDIVAETAMNGHGQPSFSARARRAASCCS
jgi:Archaeal S-adenosylmethionine synthetase